MQKSGELPVVVSGKDILAECKKTSVRPELVALIAICIAAIRKSKGRLTFVKIKNNHSVIFTNLKEPITKKDNLHLLLDGTNESELSLEFIESNGVLIGWDMALGFMFRMFLDLKYEIPESFEVAKKIMIELCEKYNIDQNFEALEKAFLSRNASKKNFGQNRMFPFAV